MLKPFLLLSAASLFALSPALIQAAGSQDAAQAPAASHAGAPNPVKPTAETQAKAKTLYGIDCAMCHGDNGNGQTDLTKSMSLNMVDFTNAKAMSSKSDGDLFDIIRNGKAQHSTYNDLPEWYIRNRSAFFEPVEPQIGRAHV